MLWLLILQTLTEYTMYGPAIRETMDIMLTNAMPCPLRQVGISSTVYWKPTFMP